MKQPSLVQVLNAVPEDCDHPRYLAWPRSRPSQDVKFQFILGCSTCLAAVYVKLQYTLDCSFCLSAVHVRLQYKLNCRICWVAVYMLTYVCAYVKRHLNVEISCSVLSKQGIHPLLHFTIIRQNLDTGILHQTTNTNTKVNTS